MKTATVKQAGENELHDQEDIRPVEDLMAYCKAYAREKPEMMALWCLGIGFVLGWKLKPW